MGFGRRFLIFLVEVFIYFFVFVLEVEKIDERCLEVCSFLCLYVCLLSFEVCFWVISLFFRIIRYYLEVLSFRIIIFYNFKGVIYMGYLEIW